MGYKSINWTTLMNETKQKPSTFFARKKRLPRLFELALKGLYFENITADEILRHKREQEQRAVKITDKVKNFLFGGKKW